MSAEKFYLDLGSHTIKIGKEGYGTLKQEKNRVVYSGTTPIGYGKDAIDMEGKMIPGIEIITPIENGVPGNLSALQSLVKHMYEEHASGRFHLRGHTYYVAIPCDVSQVEEKAILSAIDHNTIHARKILFVNKLIADAIGGGVLPQGNRFCLLVDIGHDTTEMGVLHDGQVLYSKRILLGGSRLNTGIAESIQAQQDFMISPKEAAFLKKEIGSAQPYSQRSIAITGIDINTGLPAEKEVDTLSVHIGLISALNELLHEISSFLKTMPKDFYESVKNSDLFLCGGSSQLSEISLFLEDALQIPVTLLEGGNKTAVQGLEKIASTERLQSYAKSVKVPFFE